MLHKSGNKSFTSRINALKLGFFLTKIEEVTTSLTPQFLQFKPILIILSVFQLRVHHSQITNHF